MCGAKREPHWTDTLSCLCLIVIYSRSWLDSEEHARNKATEAVQMYYQSETRYILRNVALHSRYLKGLSPRTSRLKVITRAWKKRKRPKKRQPSPSCFTYSNSRQDRDFDVIRQDSKDFSFQFFSSLSSFPLSVLGLDGTRRLRRELGATWRDLSVYLC